MLTDIRDYLVLFEERSEAVEALVLRLFELFGIYDTSQEESARNVGFNMDRLYAKLKELIIAKES